MYFVVPKYNQNLQRTEYNSTYNNKFAPKNQKKRRHNCI